MYEPMQVFLFGGLSAGAENVFASASEKPSRFSKSLKTRDWPLDCCLFDIYIFLFKEIESIE